MLALLKEMACFFARERACAGVPCSASIAIEMNDIWKLMWLLVKTSGQNNIGEGNLL